MANTCINNITFYSNDKEKIERLFKDFHTAYEIRDEKGYRVSCAYDLIKNMGYDYEGKLEFRKRNYLTNISGEIDIVELDEGNLYHFEVCTESAWTPNMQMFKELIKEEPYKGIEMVYLSEEETDDIYVNTDVKGLFYDQRYCVRIYYQDVDDYLFYDDVASVLKQAIADFPNAGIREDDTIKNIRRKIEPFLTDDENYTIIEYEKEWYEPSLDEFIEFKKEIKQNADEYLAKQSA